MTLYGNCAHVRPLLEQYPRLRLLTDPTPFSDVVVFDPELKRLPKKTRLFLFESQALTEPPSACLTLAALSCGMSARDTLSFSSVSENSALFCLSRAFVFGTRLFEPMELRVPFSQAHGLYENLTLALLHLLLNPLTPKEPDELETLSQRAEDPLGLSVLP